MLRPLLCARNDGPSKLEDVDVPVPKSPATVDGLSDIEELPSCPADGEARIEAEGGECCVVIVLGAEVDDPSKVEVLMIDVAGRTVEVVAEEDEGPVPITDEAGRYEAVAEESVDGNSLAPTVKAAWNEAVDKEENGVEF